jgi:hypothetical protein
VKLFFIYHFVGIVICKILLLCLFFIVVGGSDEYRNRYFINYNFFLFAVTVEQLIRFPMLFAGIV